MTTDTEKTRIAKAFLGGLSGRDADLLSSIMQPDVVWTMPGNHTISGEAHGIEAVVKRAQMIVDYGMKFQLQHIQLGWNGVAVSLHNTAQRDGRTFDEELVTVLTLHEGKVSHINTYMPDLAMSNAFFV